jgi:hypothetical protein
MRPSILETPNFKPQEEEDTVGAVEGMEVAEATVEVLEARVEVAEDMQAVDPMVE